MTDHGDDTLREALGMSPRRAGMLVPGMVIDDAYEITEELGRGGMGRVYRARDRRLGRDVAIKLHVTLGAHSGERLRREATALAKLAHPNVVTIHEVGTWGDHPWVAMEYVRGGTARSWLAAAPRTPREILAAYVAAGRGLAAAHAVGLVHRDFKPDNVLVGDDGRVRVADFGLARDRDAPSDRAEHHAEPAGDVALTRSGAVLGTPAYMAPEQRAGASATVGPAADQFAFAVAMWEALTGARPFAGDTDAELADAIAHHRIRETQKPDRRTARALRRALLPDPAARWPSMTALVDELARDRSRRWLAIAAGAVVLAVAGVVIGAVAQRPAPVSCAARGSETAWTPQRRAVLAGALHAEAEDVDRTLRYLDDWAGALRAQRVEACEATHERETQSPAVLDLRDYCLDRAGDALAATLDTLAALPADRVSDVVHRLPRLADCADVPRLLGRPAPGPAQRAALDKLSVVLARARAHGVAGDATRALAEARDAVALADALAWPAAQGEAQLVLAHALFATGELRELLAIYERAARLAATARDDELAARAWIGALETVALRLEKPGEADRVVAAAEAAVARAGDPPDLRAGLLAGHAQLLALRDDHTGAAALYEQARVLVETRYGADSDETRVVLNRLASEYVQLRDLDRARPLVERALAITTRLHGNSHRDVGVLLTTRGTIEAASGDFAAARTTFETALARKEHTFGADHPALVPTLMDLADVLEEQGDIAAARGHVLRAIAILEHASGPDHPQVARAYGSLAGLEIWRGDFAAADRALAKATAIESSTEQRATVAFTLAKLARTRIHHDDFAHGRELLDKALVIAGPDTLEAITVLETRGNLELSAGKDEAAVAAFRRAIAIAERLGATAARDRIQTELDFTLPR